MKALLFSQIYPSEWEPTRGPYNFNVFRAVASHCDARVVAPRPWWARTSHVGEILHTPHTTIEGLDSIYPTYWSIPGAPSIHATAMHLSLRRQIKALHRDFPFEVILAAWMYPDAVVAARIAEEYGCPFAIKILGSDINVLSTMRGLRGQIRWALSRAQRVVTVSGALRRKVIDLGVAPERAVVQHNGVDGKRFNLRDKQESRARLGVPSDRPIACSVGRLSHEKGLDILIDAVAILKKSGGPEIRLYLVGHGEAEQELKAQAARLGVQEQVVFCGMRMHDEIPDWIGACDILCLPSRREGCPNVVLEALATGRPVIAARVGGVPEILSDEFGVIVNPENPQDLAKGICQALARHWEPARQRASVECLSWDDVGKNYYRMLVETLGPKGIDAPGPALSRD